MTHRVCVLPTRSTVRADADVSGASQSPRERILFVPFLSVRRPQACIRKQHYEELDLLRPQKRLLDTFQEDVHMSLRRQTKG